MACYDCYECPLHVDNGGKCEEELYDCKFLMFQRYDSDKIRLFRSRTRDALQLIKQLEEMDTENCLDWSVGSIMRELRDIEDMISEESEREWREINDN